MTTSSPIDLRCAPWTAAQGVDPVGSAATFDHLLLVEVPLPWPAKVEDLPLLASVPGAPGLRIQTIAPDAIRADGATRVTSWTRASGRLVGRELLVVDGRVADVLAALATGAPVPTGAVTDEWPAAPEILVCTHGSRDRCCGSFGTRLAADLADVLDDEIRVRRTSHLGGHRFAPTALTLPDGRSWAFVDADRLAGIARRSIDPAEVLDSYRGSALLPPASQVVERSLFRDRGWRALDARIDDITSEERTDGSIRASVRWSDDVDAGVRSGTVRIRRSYPVLPCGLDPAEATKTSPEFALDQETSS